MLRYKDRDPQDTINIIQSFFEKKNLEVILKHSKITEIGTWHCSLLLSYKDEIVCTSNGKGASEIYSLASGYAELYERFCNMLSTVMRTYTVNKKFREYNLKNRNYIYDKREKKVSYQEAINASPRIKYSINGLTDNKGAYQKHWETMLGNNIVAIPYQGININEEKFLVPEFVILTTGSDGMAAGNTLEEAIVQGTSEVFEHYIWNNIYSPGKTYPIFDTHKLTLPNHLKEMIKIMEEKQYKLLFIDFSRIYRIPVLGLLTIDTEKHVSFLNLGAHPVFEVAFERILTETYQGRFSIYSETKPLMLPSYNFSDVDAQLTQMTSITQRPVYNEEVFFNNIIVDSINYDVFLPMKDYTNKEFYDYYIKLENELNWNFYYRDWSLTNDFKAVHVFVDNIANLGYVACEKARTVNDNNKTLIYNSLTRTMLKVQNCLEQNDTNDLTISDFLDVGKTKGEILCQKNTINTAPHDLYKTNKISFSKFLTSLTDLSRLSVLYEEMMDGDVSNLIKNKMFYYNILLVYGLNSDKYTDEQIQTIANFYGINYSLEDYANKKDINYFLHKIFIEPAVAEYNSKDFIEYIKILSEEN